MTMPSMPSLPGAGAVTDTLEFMKNLWGNVKVPGMNLPGMVMPTLSVEEIDKQIADLKAVESWLTLNMNMLHGTIKALEVQSATLSTLQSMSANFSAAMQPQSSAPAAAADDAPPFESPFARTFAPPPSVPPVPTAPTAAAPAPAAAAAFAPSKDDDSASTAAPIPLANPAAWWNMLQDQFKQAVASAAVVPSAAPGKEKGARTAPVKTAAKAARKPAAKPSGVGASSAKRTPSTGTKKPAKRKSA